MGAPKGSNNGKGKKGRSGRKSAYQEKADAELLWKIFTEPMDKDKVRELMLSGKYSIKDVFVSKAFAGNERFIIEMVKKLFPERLELDNPAQNQELEKLRLTLSEFIVNARNSRQRN